MSSTVASDADTVFCSQATTPPGGLFTTIGFKEGPTCQPKDYARWNKVLPTTRGNSMDGGPFVGVATISPGHRLNVLLKQRWVTDEKDNRVILGSTSNSVLNPEPRIVTADIYKNCLIVAPKSMIPQGCAHGEQPISRTDPSFSGLLPDDAATAFPPGEDLFLARIPNSLPYPGGYPKVFKGKATDQTIEDTTNERMGTIGAQWLRLILRFNESIHETALTNSAFEALLPKSTPALQSKLYAHPFVRIRLVEDDDEELHSADEQFRSECERLSAEAALPTVLDINGNVNGNGDTLKCGAKSSPLAFSSGQNPANFTIPKVDRMEGTRRMMGAKLKLMSLSYKPGMGATPVPTTALAHLVISSASKTEMTQTFFSGHQTTKGEYEKSRHYLMRTIRPPTYEASTKAMAGNLLFQTKKVDTLADKNLDGMVFHLFLPDNATSLAAKGSGSNKVVLESALEESEEKRTKQDTSYVPVLTIAGLGTVVTGISNNVANWNTWFNFDLEAVYADINLPYYIDVLVQVADKLTGPDSKDFYENHQGTIKETKLAYFVTHGLNTLGVKLQSFWSDVVQQAIVSEEKYMDIDLRPLQKASRFVDTFLDQIDCTLDDSAECPDCPLWLSSKEKAQDDRVKLLQLKQQLEINKPPPGRVTTTNSPTSTSGPSAGSSRTKTKGTPGTDTTNTQRRKVHDDPANLGTDGTGGYLIIPQGVQFLVPSGLNAPRPGTDFALCKKMYQTGTKCPHGQSCNRSHKAPKDLPADKGKTLFKYVKDNTLGISWNTEFVDVAELTRLFGDNAL